MESTQTGFMTWMTENFWHVAPILLAGVAATAIALERFKALYSQYSMANPGEFYDRVRQLVLANKISEAIQACDKISEKPVARVMKAGLLRANQSESLIEHGLQISVSECSQFLQKRTPFLATIANVATLLGLFGTIAGLIQSFEAVGHADPQQKGALLAAGISTAMNATMLGLGVAIPCMILFSFLISRTNKLVAETEESAIQSIDMIKQRYSMIEEEIFSGQGAKANGHLREVS